MGWLWCSGCVLGWSWCSGCVMRVLVNQAVQPMPTARETWFAMVHISANNLVVLLSLTSLSRQRAALDVPQETRSRVSRSSCLVFLDSPTAQPTTLTTWTSTTMAVDLLHTLGRTVALEVAGLTSTKLWTMEVLPGREPERGPLRARTPSVSTSTGTPTKITVASWDKLSHQQMDSNLSRIAEQCNQYFLHQCHMI